MQTRYGVIQVRHVSSSGPVWQYEAKKDEWASYSPEVSARLQAALQQGTRLVEFHINSAFYTVDLEAEPPLQRNEHSGMVRRVRCILGAPPYWDQQDADFVRRIWGSKASWRLSFSSFATVTRPVLEEEVLARFTALLNDGVFHTMKLPQGHPPCSGMPLQGQQPGAQFQVTRALQVQNLPLYLEYMEMQKKMLDLLEGSTVPIVKPDVNETLRNELAKMGTAAMPTLNERVLFHGTSPETAEEIAKTGFDLRLSRKGGLYGQGIYFARQSCKSCQYCPCSQTGDEKAIILSLVSLGDYYVTDKTCSEWVRPPQHDSSSRRAYDSIIARSGPMQGHPYKNQTHEEYIIFNERQAYPAYILYFKEV